MSKSNKSVIIDGKEEWISRSLVVIPFVYRECGGKLYFLTERRGPAVTHTGEYCGPCGYLDYDETLEQACSREVQEETGLVIDPSKFVMVDINSKPDGKKQNVNVRFYNYEVCDTLPELSLDNIITKDEVAELFWKEIGTVDTYNYVSNEAKRITLDMPGIKSLKWAFGHSSLMIHVLRSNPDHVVISY